MQCPLDILVVWVDLECLTRARGQHRCCGDVISWSSLSSFLNSHRAICLRVEAILSPGSRGWWRGTVPRQSQPSPGRGVKSESKQTLQPCVLETLSCLSSSQTTRSPLDRPLTAWSQKKASYSAWVTVPLSKKTEFECHRADVLAGEASAQPRASKVMGASVEQFLEGFLWPWKWRGRDSCCVSVTSRS